MLGIGLLVVFAGVSLLALYSRRVGDSKLEAGVLLVIGTALCVGILSLVLFVDRLGLKANQRWWTLRIGFIGISLLLWKAGNRMVGKSLR
jgi:hypothetical protein